MNFDQNNFASYNDLERNHIREVMARELKTVLDNMPDTTNLHRTVSLEYRLDRIMDCVDIMRDPTSLPIAKIRARKKKYKLLHPDRTNLEQNSRRRKQYANDADYRDITIEREKIQRATNEKYRLQKLQTSRDWDLSLRKDILSRAGGLCVICGCCDHSLMEFHHTRPEEKLFNVNEMFSKRNKDILYEEVDKCVLLCRSCHRKVTQIQRYLHMCERKHQPLDIVVTILKDRIFNDMTFQEIALKVNLPKQLIERLFHVDFCDPVTDLKQKFEAEKLQQQELQAEYKELHISNTEMVPPPPPQSFPMVPPPPVIDFETPYNLDALRRIQVFNRKHGNRCGRFAVPPVQYAAGINPYNFDQMDVYEGELGSSYSIPGAQWVTPFDFEECEG
jgi:hypothetical protein